MNDKFPGKAPKAQLPKRCFICIFRYLLREQCLILTEGTGSFYTCDYMLCIYIDLTSSTRNGRIVIFQQESLSVFIYAVIDDEAIWVLLSGLYTIVSGSTVHTLKKSAAERVEFVATSRKSPC